MTTTHVPILDLSPEVEELWDQLNDAFQRVMRSGQFIFGPEVRQFEDEAAAYLGVEHAVGVNSGTDALVIALRALGIGSGDEVITTPFSFFATAESIGIVGASPVFVDVELETYNLDVSMIEERITEKTRAILPVHLFGRPADVDALVELVEEHDLVIVEDCAQSFGARVDGRQTGSIGEVGAYSFFPTKNLGGFGDGGLLATDDEEVAEQARMLRTHGSKKKYRNELLGYNSRLDALQAALLRVKLPHIDRFNDGRRRVAVAYESALADVCSIVTPEIVSGHVFHQYTVRVLDGRRDAVREKLAEQGIQTMVYYPVPQDRLPVYEGQHPRYPNSDRLSEEVLSLPIWPSMAEREVERAADALRAAVGA